MKKTLIITGGSKGIGKSIIEKFFNEQYEIVNIARSPNELKGIKNINADLSEEGVEKKIEEQIQQLLNEQQIICLVHNAATHYHDSVGTQEKSILNESITVSVVLPALLNNIIIPYMAAESSIIYIGSTLAEKAVKNAASYVICKHALVGLMRATCQDLSNYSLHTCCICPGFTETEMLREHVGNNMDFAKNKVGAKRLIKPQEIAEIVYFSSKNQALNGAVIHANLGQLET